MQDSDCGTIYLVGRVGQAGAGWGRVGAGWVHGMWGGKGKCVVRLWLTLMFAYGEYLICSKGQHYFNKR